MAAIRRRNPVNVYVSCPVSAPVAALVAVAVAAPLLPAAGGGAFFGGRRRRSGLRGAGVGSEVATGRGGGAGAFANRKTTPTEDRSTLSLPLTALLTR